MKFTCIVEERFYYDDQREDFLKYRGMRDLFQNIDSKFDIAWYGSARVPLSLEVLKPFATESEKHYVEEMFQSAFPKLYGGGKLDILLQTLGVSSPEK